MAASRDPALLEVLSSAGLLIPDGVGVVWALRRQGFGEVGRVPGSNLAPSIAGEAAAVGASVFLLGGKEGVAGRAAAELRRKFPDLTVSGTHHGFLKSGGLEAVLAEIDRKLAEMQRRERDVQEEGPEDQGQG